jgi:hypothetical protein
MGLEPTTSCVTGRRSNQLNYRTIISRLTTFPTRDTKYNNGYTRLSIYNLNYFQIKGYEIDIN